MSATSDQGDAPQERSTTGSGGMRGAHQENPTNTVFTGVTLTVVTGAAVLSLMRIDDAGLSPNQRFNFRLAILGVTVLTLVLWVFRIWVNPAGTPRRRSIIVGVDEQIRGETIAMASYALERGYEVATSDLAALEAEDAEGNKLSPAEARAALNQAHNRLAKAVHPAMPKTLHLLRVEGRNHKVFEWLGPVRLVRMFMALGLLLVPIFVLLGLSVGVTSDGPQSDFFGGNLIDRTRVALYLVTSATIGSTFAGLTKAFRYVGNLSYDDKYESSYWIRLVLGIVAGLILAIVLSQALFDESAEAGTGFRITVPLLAIVGGFSSDLVYKMLKRVMDALETLVSGSASEQVDVAVAEIEARGRAANIEQSASTARQLIAIRDSLPADATEARNKIDETLGAVLGELPTILSTPPPSGRVEEEEEEAETEDPDIQEPGIQESGVKEPGVKETVEEPLPPV